MGTSAFDRLMSIAGASSLARRERATSSPHSQFSDEQLIRAIRTSRCKESLSILFERYARLVFTVANRLLSDANEAEEVVQDTFLYVFQKASLFDETRSTGRAWLVSVAYYRAFDRRSTRELALCRPDLPGLTTALNDGAEFATALCQQSDVERALTSISERQRKVLELHFFEGYSFKEICGLTGETLGNVRHHYYRAIEKLRKSLSVKDGTYEA